MNELVRFNFEENVVRVITIENEPWFVAKDVCTVLDLSNPTQAIERLDDDERSMFNIGRQGNTNIVNESGLYSLILGSRKPEAKKFKKWITAEVLPSIRKTRSYSVNQKPLSQIELILQSAQILADIEKKQNDLESRMDVIEKNSKEAQEQLFAFPEPTIEEANKSTRQTLVELINTVAFSDNIPHSVVWEKLYKEFSIRYHINVRLNAAKKGMSQIIWLEHNGMIDELYAVATSIFRPTMKHTLKRRK